MKMKYKFKRAIAFLIDSAIFEFPILLVLLLLKYPRYSYEYIALSIGLYGLVYFLKDIFGRSIGKVCMKLDIVDITTGKRPTLYKRLFRNFLLFFYPIEAVVALVRKDGKRISDLIFDCRICQSSDVENGIMPENSNRYIVIDEKLFIITLKRMIAFVVDWFIAICFASFFLVMFLIEVSGISAIITLGIFIFSKDIIFDGTSIGKRIFSLKTVNREDNNKPTFKALLTRSAFIFAAPLEVWAMILNRSVRIGDIMAGTKVVRVKRVSSKE